jgi:2-dehydro-3-deoxyphosphogluconate aldolase / (4S)-4-hydroxy-2-oxoglutarate aldolase
MARFDRIKVYSMMREIAIIPVFYHKDPQVAMDVVKACYAGGARVFEYTNRGDFAYDVFAELSRFIIREMPDLILGVGSVVDGPTAALYIQAGTNFIVSPSLKEDMAIICNRRKIPWIPGCGSVNEISRAEELGAEVVKIFPAGQVGGPAFIKNIKGPCPWTSIMPTGGVEPTEENLKAWFEAGAFCVGMGSKLMLKDSAGKYDLKGIEELTGEAIRIASKYVKT